MFIFYKKGIHINTDLISLKDSSIFLFRSLT